MKVFLTGSKKSKKIIGASSYLISKYIPDNFQINFINYGKYEGNLFGCNYEKISTFRFGGIKNWGKYLAEYFQKINDDYFIFSLDDYFISKQFDLDRFNYVYEAMKNDKNIANAQLSSTSQQRNKKYYNEDGNFYLKSAENNYSATCQWTLWRKSSLIDVLKNISDPWDFEINGSTILNNSGLKTLISDPPIIFYPNNSALSDRNKGLVSVFGNNAEDINKLIELNLIDSTKLTLGQFHSVSIPYKGYENEQQQLINNDKLNDDEKKYIKYILENCL